MKKLIQIFTLATLLTTSLVAAPIHDAVAFDHLARVQQLINADPGCVNTKREDGFTPLHLAAQGGHTTIVELLINHGADVNAEGPLGWISLHWTAWNGHTTTAELLINHGADVNAKNHFGSTPLDFAASNGHTEIVKLIMNKMLWHAVCRNNVEVANLALFKGASPNAIATEWMLPKKTNTPTEAIDCLNAAIARGDMPLHIAAENNDAEMVKLLLGFGGKIDTPNKGGDTPFALAAGNADVLYVILEAAKKA